MNMSKKEYNRYVARLAQKSPLGKDLLRSFLFEQLCGQIVRRSVQFQVRRILSERREGQHNAGVRAALTERAVFLEIIGNVAGVEAVPRGCGLFAAFPSAS